MDNRIDRAKMDEERLEHIRRFTGFATSLYVLPLYMVFSIADYVWYRDYFVVFGLVRVLACVLVFFSGRIAIRQTKLFLAEALTTFFVFNCIWPLQFMVAFIGDAGTPYYAGLTLTAVGVSSGFRFSDRFYLLNLMLMIVPLAIIGFLAGGLSGDSYFSLNLLFLCSTSVICSVGRYFNEQLYRKEFELRSLLNSEVKSRGDIIAAKTDEALRLHSLSKQFSPQIISSLRTGLLRLDGGAHRSEICAIFVDIVGSTEKFIRLDRDDLQKILSMYMEDVMGTFLKYDITIDKFLGDGVLGFANDPIAQSDYLERVLKAALEIRDKIYSRKNEYSHYWLSEFEFSVGIASGYASVGFYGSDLHVKSYTAIGRVINLASRLGTAAAPNEILISQDILSKLQSAKSSFLEDAKLVDKGTPSLKGFETEKIRIYALESLGGAVETPKGDFMDEVCPHGHGLLYLAQENGIYFFKCRQCDFSLSDIPLISGERKAS